MSKDFNIGDHVRWNSEAGEVSGRIIKVHTRDQEYKGYVHQDACTNTIVQWRGQIAYGRMAGGTIAYGLSVAFEPQGLEHAFLHIADHFL
jgi:hypothetical protein